MTNRLKILKAKELVQQGRLAEAKAMLESIDPQTADTRRMIGLVDKRLALTADAPSTLAPKKHKDKPYAVLSGLVILFCISGGLVLGLGVLAMMNDNLAGFWTALFIAIGLIGTGFLVLLLIDIARDVHRILAEMQGQE